MYSCLYTGLHRPRGFQEVEAPKIYKIMGTQSGNIVSPMLQSHLPPGKTLLITMKDLEYLIVNRTLDLTACSAVPQPTALLQAT